MISAFKRLVATNDNKDKDNSGGNANNSSNKNSTNANTLSTTNSTTSLFNNGMQMISQSLQKKFSKGVNYNMKIVIRGDCNVGKTTLWLRLQGHPFKETYETSDEIKVANIQWNYKTTDDIVKVEVWDVVDRSKKKRTLLNQQKNSSNSATLKLDNESNGAGAAISKIAQPVEASLDAEFIDVYKNASGVLLVYDITKQWTWEYIERELPKIPTHIPVLIIGNHRDMNHHRNIDELKCKYFIENLSRGSLGSAVRYTETSMRTGFGLKYIYKFFNIPYLQLQRETLMQQLETNAKEMDLICEELQEIEDNIENDYDAFSQNLNTARRQQQEENAKDILKNAKSIEEARKLALEREAAAALAAQEEAQTDPKKALNSFINKINNKVSQTIQNTQLPAPISMSVTIDPNDKKNKSLNNLTNSISHNNLLNKIQSNASKSNMNEFSHDEELNRFLDDPLKSNKSNSTNNIPDTKLDKNYDDDDDDETSNGNPMVAIVKETIDSSDEKDLNKKDFNLNTKVTASPIYLSDEDDAKKSETKAYKSSNTATSSLKESNNEFVFVNNKSINNSTYSNSSNDAIITNTANIEQINPITKPMNQTKLDSFSATSSIINFETGSSQSQSQSGGLADTNPIISDNQQFKLTNDDFDFLENITSYDKANRNSTSKSNNKDEDVKKTKKSSEKKIKSSKSSTKLSEDSQSFNDDSSVNSSTKKNKKSKDLAESKEKKEKKKSKSSASKSTKKSSRKHNDDDEEDDDDNQNSTYVKKDEDYEEL